MTNRPAPPPPPLPARLLTTTVDADHPRLGVHVFIELACRDLVLLHDALVMLEADPAFQALPAAQEELEIIRRRLVSVLLVEGVR